MVNKQLRKIKFLLIKLLRIKSNAHNIAMGFTLGLLINFVPSFGIGPILSAGLAKLFRGNPVAGFIGGISIIWMFPLLFYLNIVVGEIVFPIEAVNIEEGLEDTEEVLEVGFQIGKAFIIGMIMNMIFFGIIIYLMIFTVIKKYRREVLMFINKKWTIQK
jgi:uncharacterized protein (DUF2062 family)